jgi:hypothetical protein
MDRCCRVTGNDDSDRRMLSADSQIASDGPAQPFEVVVARRDRHDVEFGSEAVGQKPRGG